MPCHGSFEEEAVENSLGEAATAPGNGGKPLPADEQMAMLKEENGRLKEESGRLKETIAALLSSRSSDATVDPLAGTPSRPVSQSTYNPPYPTLSSMPLQGPARQESDERRGRQGPGQNQL